MNKKGFSLLSLSVGLFCTAITIIPITAWYLITDNQNSIIENNLHKLTLAEDRVLYLKNLPTEEIKNKCEENFKSEMTVREKYLLSEDFHKEGSENAEYKVKISLLDKDTDEKYTIEKVLLSEQNEAFKSISYVNNKSFPDYKVSVLYDEKENKIKYYIDNKELHPQKQNNFESGSGYAVFDNGLIIQWGRATSNGITFKKKFPHKCFNIVSTVSLPETPSYIYSFNQNSANIETYGHYTNWVALGY